MSETKECKCCKKVLPIENFTEFFNKCRGKTYTYGSCDSCRRENAKKKYYSKTPEERREKVQRNKKDPLTRKAYKLKHKYNLTLERYNNMLIEQDDRCPICDEPLVEDVFEKNVKGVSNKPHVDHCHETGRVRGLVCKGCNLILGYAKDDPNILYNAIDYLINKKDIDSILEAELLATERSIDSSFFERVNKLVE